MRVQRKESTNESWTSSVTAVFGRRPKPAQSNERIFEGCLCEVAQSQSNVISAVRDSQPEVDMCIICKLVSTISYGISFLGGFG